MQYCPSNHNTLNETKQRYVDTQYTQVNVSSQLGVISDIAYRHNYF